MTMRQRATEDGTLIEYMLTTVDNPFDPFTQFDAWYSYDASLGYHTPGLLARFTTTSDDLAEVDQFIAIQDAIDEVIELNLFGVHRKVKRGEVVSLNEGPQT